MSQALSLTFEDFTGFEQVSAPEVPADALISDVLSSVTSTLRLPSNDVDGAPILYSARSTLTGEVLNGTDKVGDVLQSGETVQLQRVVTAG